MLAANALAPFDAWAAVLAKLTALKVLKLPEGNNQRIPNFRILRMKTTT
jgi:hypothetical protein